MKILLSLACLMLSLANSRASADDDFYGAMIRKSEPTAWWRFEKISEGVVSNEMSDHFSAAIHGKVTLSDDAPRRSAYPDFSIQNLAAQIPFGKNYLIVKDPGLNSDLDFSVGDAITLEAWVKLAAPLKGSYPYIIGKGRTHNAGTHHNNQSYSLRLATSGGGAALSFFFVDPSGSSTAVEQSGHRWTSMASVPMDGFWHHVAISYQFGDPESMRGYLDGNPVSGKWDLAGQTQLGPINDDDELWIGSAMGGGATLGAALDEVALYRRSLTEAEIKEHAKLDLNLKLFFAQEQVDDAPPDKVQVDILETLTVTRSWDFQYRDMEPLYETDLFAMKEIPRKYDDKGLIIDRPIPSLIRMTSTVDFAAGEYEFLLRSLDASRLYIDGQLICETGFMHLDTSAHQAYYDRPDYGDELLSLAAGHAESRHKLKLSAGPHIVALYRSLGNKGHGNFVGELSVGYSKDGERFKFLAPQRELSYTDASWLTFLDEDHIRLRDWNQTQRLAISQKEAVRWESRHAWAQSQLQSAPQIPEAALANATGNAIDKFIEHALSDARLSPTGEISDWAFLRRAALDTTGKIPSPELINDFFALSQETRRSQIIDQLLADPSWADHWTTYWQDVLAENPGLTKPMLNNTGPFRWFIYESMLDNKPFDRFVTELISMEGSPHTGGPAGFSIASQNDVPMAAKAHVLGTAFLAVEMTCARCHDAPYHDVKQQDLFSIAAMLKRAPEKVPGSSTIPLTPEEVAKLAVKVTLQPGSSVKPDWPFVEFVSIEDHSQQQMPAELIADPDDPREQLANMITSPANQRFAKVIVNRVWGRLMGRGIVHPVDDWEEATPSHPELLDYLAHQFVESGYDLKAISRLIMNSDLYQRAPVAGLNADSLEAKHFQGPIRRKMTGEQVVDSLFAAVEKPLASEELTMDGDGRHSDDIFGHLGIPDRAWQFTAVSNERDRPSLNLPVAQSIIDLMSAYGWRQQRQEPLTHREDPLTALQPMALSNGTSALRAIDFSDDSALTQAAIDSETVEQFIETLFQRILTRTPTSEERELFVAELSAGFADRVIAGPDAVPPQRIFRTGITWSNHFDPKSDNEAIARSQQVIEGDPQSVRLDPNWRERAEDVAWTLVNSPEFVFVP